MHAREVAGVLSFIVMVGAGFLSENADSRLERGVWYAVAVGALIWYVVKGSSLKGWIGDSYQEMKEEIARLERFMEKWEYSDGRSIPFEKRSEIQERHNKLIRKIHFHPDAPRN